MGGSPSLTRLLPHLGAFWARAPVFAASVLSPKFASKILCHPERRLADFSAKRSRKPALSEFAAANESNGDLHFEASTYAANFWDAKLTSTES